MKKASNNKNFRYENQYQNQNQERNKDNYNNPNIYNSKSEYAVYDFDRFVSNLYLDQTSFYNHNTYFNRNQFQTNAFVFAF